MKYSLYLGCTVPSRAHNYEVSARLVAGRLGIEFVDSPEFGCCGLPLKSGHYETFLSIAAYNLAVAQELGLPLVVFCNGCFGALTDAKNHLHKNEKERMRINELLEPTGKAFTNGGKIMHFSSVLYEHIGIDRIKDAVTNNLEGLKIAPHYGCHYLRPGDTPEKIDNPKKPSSLDNLIEATGASSISYEDMLQCCASPLLGPNEKNAVRIGKMKLDHIKQAGADAMVIHCPLCSIMYDQYQPTIEQEFGVEYKLPVLYYSQLLGLAMGFNPKELGMKKNKVKADGLFAKMGVSV